MDTQSNYRVKFNDNGSVEITDLANDAIFAFENTSSMVRFIKECKLDIPISSVVLN